LFTDIEGSTRLWQQDELAMRGALSRHDELVRKPVAEHGGVVFATMGDGMAAAFASASGAVNAAVAAQRWLGAERWPTATPLRVRMGIHTGEAEWRDGDYVGTAVNRAARLMGVGHGGQVLCSSATADLLADTTIGLVDLGEHHLRDLDRPMHIFQVGTERFPPLRSLDLVPGNLPAQLTSFVGRREELTAIAEALDAARLVTVTGVGGVGKTRLAAQAAADGRSGFGDGVWLCELAGANSAASMGELVAATLGVASRARLDLGASVVQFLAPKDLLVVLDNCEHLLDAAAGLVAAVLAGCPRVRVLATSREALGLAGERIMPLRSLAVPGPSWGVEAVVAADAVRLFADRAETARPGFVVSPTNAGAVGEICRRLDGIPLALELAAVRVATMTPGEIAGHLDERFRLLGGRRRGAVQRHQTLRATLDWSYSLLDPAERMLFDRLGVFAGSFDAEAAVAVAAGEGSQAWDVFDGLASLAAKSMVTVDAGEADPTRYRLLETMRHYARERLAADGDADRWQRRHAEHYAGLAEVMGRELNGPDELVWRPRLAAELDDLRAAVDWSLDSDGGHAVRIVAALAIQAAQQDKAGIGGWAERCVAAAQIAPAALRASVLAAAAFNQYRRGGPAVLTMASNALRDGLPADCPATYLPHMALGASLFLAGHNEQEALSAFADGHAALDAISAPPNGHAHLYMAEATVTGDPAVAGDCALAALAAARLSANPTALAIALCGLAYTCSVDDPAQALAAATESITLTRAGAGDGVYGLALCLAAALHARKGGWRAPLALLVEALQWSHDSGNIQPTVWAVDFGIQVMADLGHPHLAAIPPQEQSQRDTKLAAVRQQLGVAAFDADLQQGATMGLDAISAYLLAQISQLENDPARPAHQ
jgi:predicted ATPase